MNPLHGLTDQECRHQIRTSSRYCPNQRTSVVLDGVLFRIRTSVCFRFDTAGTQTAGHRAEPDVAYKHPKPATLEKVMLHSCFASEDSYIDKCPVNLASAGVQIYLLLLARTQSSRVCNLGCMDRSFSTSTSGYPFRSRSITGDEG